MSEEEASSGDPTYSFNAETTNKDGSVNYEIFVRSFYDHDGDGTGDLLGVKDKLPYLFDMGVKTLWLLPIQNSPSYHGYDVSDYCSVNPDYGTIDDFDALVEEAEKYNIEIMIDMVLNHSSNQHPWFRESYEDYVSNNTDDTSKQDWYNWSETLNEGYSSYNGTYYEARFDSSMPDLNLDCKALRQEIDSIFRFWINDHGVKGFRLDAVKYFYNANIEKNIEFLDFLMDTARQYDSNFYMVGEDWESDAVNLLYYESKCPSFFRFDMSSSIVNTAKGYGKASNFVDEIVVFEPKMHAKNPDAYAGYFLSNHDQDRPTFSTVEDAKLAASLEVLLPGDIWLYYGEEIQLWGKRQNSENSDVRRRLPMIWSKEDKTGECSFPDMSRSDLMGYTQVEDGVYDNLAEPRSLINHYKKLINARNTYNCFKHGNAQSLIEQINDESDSVVAYQLTDGDVSVQIYTNCGTEAKAVTVSGTKILEDIDTMAVKSSLEGTTLTLQPYSTVLMA
ncbi:MAG: hypothetical protein K6F32_04835 [Bacilli bacterium]|nr:hypothetical protein [Bacilli bacterium]